METRNCQNCKKDFTIDPDDFSFYQKMAVPPPTFCPECRLIRRLARRNERVFHRRACEKCGKAGISIFAEDAGIHVYCAPCWWGDSWDATLYAVDYDPSKPFLAQLCDLFHTVPMMALYGIYTTLVNSDYTNMAGWLKNCYMVTYSDYGENLIYGSFVNYSKDSVDNLMGKQLELCYETINCNQCYNTFFSVDCVSCTNVWFSKNCVGCSNCFGCVNIQKKNYYIYNVPYSKEEYEAKMKEIFPLTQAKISLVKEKAQELWKQFPQKFMHGIRTIDSSGDYITDTKNAKNCFIGFNIEDSRYCSFVTGKMTDTYDFVNFGANSSLMYEVLQGGDQSSNLKMSHWTITDCFNIEYGLFLNNCKDCFGCVGLKKKQYCILNKQYTKEEYFALRSKIMAEMDSHPYIDAKGREYKYGEFFPIEQSPFAYNDSTAQEFFPLTKEEALAKGYPWREPDARNYAITMQSLDLPQAIEDTPTTITSEIIGCEHGGKCTEQCTTAFKIVPEELAFYKRLNLPIPHLCPNCRHHQRLQFRNPMKLWHRQCMCEVTGHGHEARCSNEFETSYAPDRDEVVYCEGCYQKEVM